MRAVILKTWGSTPREVGADMVVEASGTLRGTVGGGCGEAEVYELALELLQQQGTAPWSILHVDLTDDPAEGGGKVCGGRFDVLLQVLEPSHRALLSSLLQATESGESRLLRSSLGQVRPGFWKLGGWRADFPGDLAVSPNSGLTDCSFIPGEENEFWEPVGLTRKLVIVGAGHIARPLCAMASMCDYSVSVLDDRPEYAHHEFFPTASEVCCAEYRDRLPELCRGDLVSVVLVTRGHRHDQECLRLVAEMPLEYLGMIGSQRRVEAVFSELIAEGVARSALARVRAPIGLEIGAQTPAEISLAILAEMVRGRRQATVDGQVRPRERHIRSLSKEM